MIRSVRGCPRLEIPMSGSLQESRSLDIDQLNTVETSVQTWLEFVDASMTTGFYEIAYKRNQDPTEAAAFTLLRNYIGTFAPEERSRLESDVEYFYKYAEGFINELAPYRFNKKGYIRTIRAAFLGKIKTLLRNQKDENGKIKDPDRYVFIRTIVHFCSSLDFIIQMHDRYKEFLFREMPQIRNEL